MQLKKYAEFLFHHHLDDLTTESIQSARDLNLPLLKLFSSFSKEELFQYSKTGIAEFLRTFINGNALEVIHESNEQWNANKLPGIPKDQIESTDIVLAHALRKLVLLKFLDTYAQTVPVFKSLALEIETFYTKVYEISFTSFLDVQKEGLRKEKDFNESLITFSQEAIVAFDKNLLFTAWNPRIEIITGMKKKDVLGKHIFEIFPEIENTDEGKTFLRVLEGETVHIPEGKYKDQKGFFESYVTPLLDDKQKVIGGLSIVHDITERKHAEDQLKETEYFLQHVADASPDLIYVLDLITGENIYANRQFADVLGYEKEDISEQGFALLRRIIHPLDVKILDERISKFKKASDQEVIESEIRFLKKSGAIVWLNVKSKIFKRDKIGKPLQIMGLCSDITKRKQTEEALNLSRKILEDRELQLLEAQEIANLGSYDWNLLEDTASTTPMLREIFGYEKTESVLFGEFQKFIHPEDKQKVVETLNESLKSGNIYSCEYRIYKRNTQDLRYVWAKGKIDYDTDGKPKRMLGTVWDITERKLVEEKLKNSEKNLRELNLKLEEKVFERTNQLAESSEKVRQSEQQMRLITNALPALVSYVDKEERFRFINERYSHWFGDVVKDIIGNSVKDLLGPVAYQKMEGYIHATLRNGEEVNYETEMPYLHGGTRYVQGKFIPDLDENGHAKGMITLIIDISERKQAEETLKSAFKHASIGMTITDLEGKYLYINPVYSKITGYTETELQQMTTNMITHTDDLPIKTGLLRQMILMEIPGFVIDKRYIRKDGGFIWVQNSVSLIRDAEGKPYNIISLTQDITKEKEAQEQVKQSATLLRNINLELSQKNEQLIKINNDLDNFVYTASHDLKAPVSNIEGLINTLSETLQCANIVNEDINLIVELINSSILRFKNTIIDLTQITKIQKDLEKEISEINLCEIIEDVKFSINDQIIASKAKIFAETALCPIIKFSKKDLNSIIYNLLSNAMKYRSPERTPEIHITTSVENEFIVLSVADNGLGISESNKSKVFQMFKRFHDHVEGSGIGLYIVKRIVENNGGRIDLESEVNIGTTFRVFLRA